MKCVICKQGKTRAGTTTVTLERDASIMICKKVPAQICENCGEYYLSEAVSERLFSLAEDAITHKAEFEVLKFPSAASYSSRAPYVSGAHVSEPKRAKYSPKRTARSG